MYRESINIIKGRHLSFKDLLKGQNRRTITRGTVVSSFYNFSVLMTQVPVNQEIKCGLSWCPWVFVSLIPLHEAKGSVRVYVWW